MSVGLWLGEYVHACMHAYIHRPFEVGRGAERCDGGVDVCMGFVTLMEGCEVVLMVGGTEG